MPCPVCTSDLPMVIRNVFRALVSFLLFMWQAGAEAGISLIGLCHRDWDCAATLEYFKSRTPAVFGFLMGGTFGDDCPCAQKLLTLPQQKIVRIHLANSTCFQERGRLCGEQELFYGLSIGEADRAISAEDPKVLSKFERSMREAERLLVEVQGPLECYISPCLECNLSPQARGVLLRLTKRHFPECAMVDNPIRGACLPGYVCEAHGARASLSPPCIADLDGEELPISMWRAFHQRFEQCNISFWWSSALNCISGPKFTPPRERACGTVVGEAFRELSAEDAGLPRKKGE